jgi:hypothetical protein
MDFTKLRYSAWLHPRRPWAYTSLTVFLQGLIACRVFANIRRYQRYLVWDGNGIEEKTSRKSPYGQALHEGISAERRETDA